MGEIVIAWFENRKAIWNKSKYIYFSNEIESAIGITENLF